jgi:hypothetical protein
MSNKRIGKKLLIPIKTVKNYIIDIYTEISVNNRVQFPNLIRDFWSFAFFATAVSTALESPTAFYATPGLKGSLTRIKSTF